MPDAVLYAATRDAKDLGAQEILDWAQRNSERVQVLSTETYYNYIESIRQHPGRREKDLGERAALEAIHDAIHLNTNERAVLLTEDDRVLRQVLVLDADLTQRMIPITTQDFLTAMETAHRINSTDAVYKRAANAGRAASRRQAQTDQHETARNAVERMIRRRLN